jgi:hypothetical protein
MTPEERWAAHEAQARWDAHEQNRQATAAIEEEEVASLDAPPEEYVSEAPVLDATDVRFQEATLRNIGEGAQKTWGAVKDLAYRGDEMIQGWAGNDSVDHTDALSGILRDNADRARSLSAINEKFPVEAAVGGFVGETAALAPIGLIGRGGSMIYQGGKAAISKLGRFGTGAAEGAATGFVGTQGDMGDRLMGAGIEGALGGTLEVGMGSIGDAVANRGRGGMRDNYVEGGVAKHEKTVADEIARTQKEAGYTKSYGDVVQDQGSFDIRDTGRNVQGDNTVADFEAKQEADINLRAQALAESTGGSQRTPNQLGDGMQDTLGAERQLDLDTVDANYDKWRASHGGNVRIDTGGSNGDGLFDRFAALKVGDKQQKFVDSTLKDLFERKGLAPDKSLSVDEVEDIIIDLNSYWSKLDPDGTNGVIRDYKKVLDEYVVEGFGDVSRLPANHPVRLGKEARETKRAMHEKWDADKTTTKISDKNQAGAYENTGLWSLNQLRTKGNHKEMRAAKLQMEKTPQGKKDWDDFAATELFEALEAAKRTDHVAANTAGNGVENVGTKQYNARFSKLDTEAQDIVFGKKKADEIRNAIEAWSQRGRQTGTRGDPTKEGSGRSRNILQGAVRLAATGSAGGKLLALIPTIGTVVSRMADKRLVKDFTENAMGRMTKTQRKDYIVKLKEEFDKTFAPEVVEKYGQQFNLMLREALLDEEDNNATPTAPMESPAGGKTQP